MRRWKKPADGYARFMTDSVLVVAVAGAGGGDMLPNFLVPESEQRSNGESNVLELGPSQGKVISLTLGITRIIEQESLDVAILGSADGENWDAKPLISFPQKFYCGTYAILLDLSKHPEIGFLKARWKMNRWGRGKAQPLFEFYLFVEETADVPAAARA